MKILFLVLILSSCASVEADPLNGKLSNVTPLAVALMDRMVSDEEIEVEVEPREFIRIIDVK